MRLMRFAPAWDVSDAMRKALRTTDGLTVQSVAARLGVSRNTVSNWLNGRVRPDQRTLIAWAEVTGVPYRWLTSFQPHTDPLRPRFTADEITQFASEAADQGETLSIYLRRYATPLLSDEDLAELDSNTLMQMWFENNRVYHAQREDTGEREAATVESVMQPEMSRRIENILNSRQLYPALELLRREDERTQFDSPDST